MMKTLFLQPPSFDGFDGGAGSRYQAKREIKSFWFPTWLAQPAALVPGSKLIDAPPARLGLDAVTRQIGDYELCVMHTSTPSFASDVKVAEALKAVNPSLKIGMVGAKVAVQPAESLAQGGVIDFVARNEFDFTVKEIAEGRDWGAVDGIGRTHPYEVEAAITFLDAAGDPDGDATRIGELAREQNLIGTAPEGYAPGETHEPYDFAKRPGSHARAWFGDDEFERSLDALEAEQGEDGGWQPKWAIWTPATKAEWGGIVTLRALRTLERFSRPLAP